MRVLVLAVVLACLLAPPAAAQVPSARQTEQVAEFTAFMRAYEAAFGPMPPALRRNMIATASNEIAAGRYESFIAGLRQALGVPPDFGQRPPGEATAPRAPGEGAIAGMRVYYLQRSPLGLSHADGYVHFCPGGRFHETTTATVQRPGWGNRNVNAGSWRMEGQSVALYYQQGPRAGDRIAYRVADMMAGRWRTTNWDYAVDRQAVC